MRCKILMIFQEIAENVRRNENFSFPVRRIP